MLTVGILLLNLIAAHASAGASLMAIRRPQSLSGSLAVDAGEIFYCRMYAVRSVPLGLLAGVLPLVAAGPAVVAVLLLAAVVQLADVFIAAAKRERGMIAGASAGTAIHLAAALIVWLHVH